MKKINTAILSIVASLSILSAGGNTPIASEAIVAPIEQSGLSYEFQLYAFAPWMEGDASMGYKRLFLDGEDSIEGITIDMSPRSIVDTLKMGIMAHLEAHQDSGWGLWLDYSFMNLGKDITNAVNLGMFQGILEAFATYRVPLERGYIDYYGGLRWWRVALDMTIKSYTKEKTFDWYDPTIGLVWVTPIADDWHIRARADVAGFGIGSDFSSTIELGLLYDINEDWQVDMHMRSIWVDYEDGEVGREDRFAYDTVSYGPVVGITYRF